MAYLSMRVVTLTMALVSGAAMAFPGISEAQDRTTGVGTPAGTAGDTPETVEVIAPRLLKFETQPTNGTLQKASLEGPVRYDDLDLRTDDGVVALRDRIANEAADICAHLAQVYPVYAAAGTSCVKDAIEDATIRANRVIQAVRSPSY